MNFKYMQVNIIFYACNKSDHIAKYFRIRNVNRRGLEDKSEILKTNEKEKEKVEEIREKMKKTRVKKSDDNAVN